MFKKVLIANRGEIAVRIMRACRALNIPTVAVYSTADRDALHVRLADERVCIGPPSPAASYLNIPAIVSAALSFGADAVHPGYGFLSENGDFAEACQRSGLVFIGPRVRNIRIMGDKPRARRIMERAGVPVLSGTSSGTTDVREAQAVAAQIGFPVLIKAAAGGGGRGLRIARTPDELAAVFSVAREEGEAAFGDGALYVEKYLERARHIEFQIIADQHRNVLHLGERECSVQRRHQKIVEEAPSPAVSAALRAEMGAAAVRVARAAGYTNAGTAEFMLAPDGSYYFLEMNARLQVEHPVTEYVTGLDLVALQLRVAAGEPLPFTQDEVALRGHALECRLYAEDPAAGFLPATGRLGVFTVPRGPGLRLDTGVETGDEVTIHYDPMLAKLIAGGQTRHEALARGLWALRRAAVLGVTTNLAFLAAIVSHPAFVAGELSTDFLQRHQVAEPAATASHRHAALLLAALWQATVPPAPRDEPFDPWRSAHWSPTAGRTLRFSHGETEHAVELRRSGSLGWAARIDDTRYDLASWARHGDDGLTLRLDGQVLHGQVVQRESAILVAYAGQAWTFRLVGPPDVDERARRQSTASAAHTLTAPMPGTVIKVYVQAGERVEPHQRLAVMEAMKMEHVVEAPYTGTVRAILHAEGEQVPAGEQLIELAQD